MDGTEADTMATIYRGNNILGLSLLCVSITSVLLAMVIFSYFMTLQNFRSMLLKQLLVAFLFDDVITLALQALVYFARNNHMPDLRCLFRTTAFCETLLVLSKYGGLASFSWMVAVVYHQWLHSKPLYNGGVGCLAFSLWGWGFPAIPTLTWTLVLVVEQREKCWPDHYFLQTIWILESPKLLILLFILVLSILTLWKLYKLKREIINIEEVLRKRAHLKQSGLVCLWVGLAHVTLILTTRAPVPLDQTSMASWSYVVTILISSRGLVVSLLFCFLDRDVILAMTSNTKK